jgi:hypothetical protein
VINRTDEAELKKYWRLWDLGLLVSYPNDFLKTQTTAQQLTPGPDILRIQVASLVTRFKVCSSSAFSARFGISFFLS